VQRSALLFRTARDVSSQPQTSEEQYRATSLPPDVEPDQLPRAFFGYERSTIVELLNKMSGRVRGLMQERVERERRITELEQQLARYLESQRLIGEILVNAREEAEKICEEARRSAGQDLLSAREQGERIIAEAEQAANERAAATVRAAQQERDAIIHEGNKERQALLDEAAHARAFVDQTHEQLSDFLMAAVRWYEQAKPSADGDQSRRGEAEMSPNDRSSTPSSVNDSLTPESQSTSSSSGRSDE
jgi:cell division septum initiation protein DivIVA